MKTEIINLITVNQNLLMIYQDLFKYFFKKISNIFIIIKFLEQININN